jgi:nucleotide-binding universal stress UspA family protein
MKIERQTKGHFSRILVATDGSEGAATALRAALDLAAQARADLVVLNVFQRDESSTIHAPEIRQFSDDEPPPEGHDKAKETASRTILGEAKTIVDERPGVSASFVFLEGDAATEILRYAAEIGADLIALGRSGRNRIVGLVLGSVSQKVVSLAPQPILIGPPVVNRS